MFCFIIIRAKESFYNSFSKYLMFDVTYLRELLLIYYHNCQCQGNKRSSGLPFSLGLKGTSSKPPAGLITPTNDLSLIGTSLNRASLLALFVLLAVCRVLQHNYPLEWYLAHRFLGLFTVLKVDENTSQIDMMPMMPYHCQSQIETFKTFKKLYMFLNSL